MSSLLLDTHRARLMRALDAADRAALPGFPTGPMSEKWLDAFLPALEAQGLRIWPHVGGETCSAGCWPSSGGSYVCALTKGHDGPHASLWNQSGPNHPVIWDGETVTWT